MNVLALNATLEHDRFYYCSTAAGEVCNLCSTTAAGEVCNHCSTAAGEVCNHCSTTAGEVCNLAFLEYGQLTAIVACVVLFFSLIPFPALSAEPAIHFTDVTDPAGIHFTHTNGASGEFHLPETLGSGGAFLDYNNDGYLDLYLVNSAAPSVLYRNNGDGTFTDVTVSAGVGNQGSYTTMTVM